MRYLSGLFTLAAFFLWIQPLGAFIAPSMEEAACGGNRAFHMCSTQFAAQIASSPAGASGQKTHMTSSTSVGVEKTGQASGSGAQMDIAGQNLLTDVSLRRFADAASVFPAQIFFSPASPVPKR